MTIILDAGHGGADSGATFNGRLEKDDTLEVVLALGELLQSNGVDVLYTRTEDVFDSPLRKAQLANESGADYLISIHRNSSVVPGQYTGVQTLLYDESGVKKEMADNINQELADVGYRNIGTDVRRDLAVLRRTSIPALLVELGFINSDIDNNLLDTRFDDTIQAIADGILSTIGSTAAASRGVVMSDNEDMQMMDNPAPPMMEMPDMNPAPLVTPNQPDGRSSEEELSPYDSQGNYKYSVQVGLYRQYQNAVNMAERLKAIRIPVEITRKGDLYAVLAGKLNTLEAAVRLERLLRLMCFDTLIVAV